MFGCSKIVSMWLSEGKDQHFLKSKNLLSLSIGWKEKKNLFFKSFGLYFVPYLWKVPDSLEQTGKISVIKLLYFNGDKYSLVFLTTTKKKQKHKRSVYPHQYYAHISQIVMTPTVKFPYQQDAKLANHRGVFPMITLLCIKHLRCQAAPVHTEWQLTTARDSWCF